MKLTEALRKPENRMSKDRCTDLMDKAAAYIEQLEKEADDTRRLALELYSATTAAAVQRAT